MNHTTATAGGEIAVLTEKQNYFLNYYVDSRALALRVIDEVRAVQPSLG